VKLTLCTAGQSAKTAFSAGWFITTFVMGPNGLLKEKLEKANWRGPAASVDYRITRASILLVICFKTPNPPLPTLRAALVQSTC